MGSVVKSIGRVFKKVGKTLKKIAPVLLVAAAAYVGYGFATGFTGGGWPKITGWGKSLMSGIRGGSTLSQAASQASQGITGEVATSAVTTPASFPPNVVGQAADPFAFEDARAAASQAGQGMLGGTQTISPSGDYMAMGPFSGILGDVPPTVSATSPTSAFDLTSGSSGGGVGPTGGGGWGDQVLSPDAVPGFGGQPLLEPINKSMNMTSGTSVDPFAFEDAKAAFRVGADLTHPKTWIAAMGSKAGHAWKFYKELWKNDPMIALYGTNKVIQMVAAMLAKDEREKKYDFGGFNADVSYSQLRDIQGSRTRPAPKPGTVLGPRKGLLGNSQGAAV